MAKGNKYYWLKLKEDFFEDDAINWIEEQPNGKDYCLFYLKLCLKSLKSEGLLIRNVGNMLVPYDAKKLSDLTNTDVDTVKVAMDMFKKIGLVDILENGEIFMNQLNTMVGKETDYAEQKRIQRENKKQIEQKDNVHLLSLESPKIVHTEIEKEIEKEKEKEIYFESDDKTLNLTNQQKEKLLENKEDIDIDYYIERIVAYNETKPKSKKYKSLYLTLGDWIRRDIENNGKYVKVLKIFSNTDTGIINDYSDVEFIGG